MGVRFIAVNDGIDSTAKKSYGDNIIIPFKNLINDAYCRDISVKIRSQLEIKRKKGDFIGSFAVFGYLKDEKHKNRLIVDEYAAAIVRDIFKWKIDGMSQQGIADRLNELGILSPYEYKRSLGLRLSTSFKQGVQAKWSAVAVGRILKDEIYVGTLAQGKTSTPNHKVKKKLRKPKEDWVRTIDNHEPIITRDEFELANSLLRKDMRISPNEETVYLFSGLLKCADCNENMIRKTVPSGDKKYFYYVCAKSKSKKGACKSHSVSEGYLTEAVTATLQAHIDYVLNVERILAFIDTLPLKQEEVQKLDKQIIKKKEEIQRFKDLKVSLYESMVSGIIDEKEYSYLKKRYNEQCDEAERALFALGAEIEKILSNKGEKNFWIEQFKAHHNFIELTRKIVVSLIEEIIIYEDNRINIRFRYQSNLETTLSFISTVGNIATIENIELIKEAV